MRSHGLCPKLITLILSVLLRVSQRLRVLVVKAAPNPPRRHEDEKKHNPQPCAFDPVARSPPGSFNSTMPAAVGFIPERARSAAQKAVGRKQKAEGGKRKLPSAFCLLPSAVSGFDLVESFGPHLWFGLLAVAFRVLPPLLKHFRDQPCPAGLMAGSVAASVIAVEIFMEEQELVPLRVTLEFFVGAKDRTAAFAVLQEDRDEPFRQIQRHFPERLHPAGSRGALHFEVIPKIVVELLQQFDHQEVDRH